MIIDSLSHAWAGQGGILEFLDKATQSLKNNFAAWREASPKHNNLVDALIQSNCYINGHPFKDMTTEEVSEQVANLEKCLQDSNLLGKLKQILNNSRKAA